MISLQASVQCLDIGNTKTKFGTFRDGTVTEIGSMDTKQFTACPTNLLPQSSIRDLPLACCSVVPQAERSLRELTTALDCSLFMLTSKTCRDLPISYPFPEEIGADRLANSLAAHTFFKTPSIVIDFGTATTFDIVTQDGGYEGGVIVPGPQGYLDFLHQNTSLLPLVNIDFNKPRSNTIGKSTVEAMELGVRFGYRSMIMGILDELFEFFEDSYNTPEIILAGGAVKGVGIPNAKVSPNLTLEGLALAFQKNHGEGLKP
tara:strand:- start:5499 stop:6278 length:780 start_codon:yes stop_codon:yes gene_type:complete